MNSPGTPEEDGTAGEGLLRRWARRKQAAKAQPVPAPPAADPASEAAPAPAAPAEAMPVLPDLDTLDAGSDYSAFLQQGVPAELQRLALQRAWSSDAAIAEFRGMAEYAWDFNAPQYGQLWPVDDVAKLIRAVMATPDVPLPEPSPAVAEIAPVVPYAVVDEAAVLEAVVDGASQETGQSSEAVLSRRHGSALPS